MLYVPSESRKSFPTACPAAGRPVFRDALQPASRLTAGTCRQVACHFFPSVRPEASVRRMKRWLADDPELLAALRRAGYRDRQRRFTRGQVAVLREYLGG